MNFDDLILLLKQAEEAAKNLEYKQAIAKMRDFECAWDEIGIRDLTIEQYVEIGKTVVRMAHDIGMFRELLKAAKEAPTNKADLH